MTDAVEQMDSISVIKKVAAAAACSKVNAEGVEKQVSGSIRLKDKVVCPVCGLVITRMNVRRHLRNKHQVDPGPFNTKVLPAVSGEQVKAQEYKKPFTCSKCDKPFQTISTVRNHYKHFHKHSDAQDVQERNFSCKLCTTNFRCYFQLLEHSCSAGFGQRPREVSYPLHCDRCERSFTTRLKFKLHGCYDPSQCCSCKVCSRFGEYTCWYCQKICKTPALLRQHKRLIHSRSRWCVCDVCGKEFSFGSTLSLHRQTKHGIGQRRMFHCKPCGKVFPTRSQYELHSSTHRGEKSQLCSTCGNLFSTSSSLNSHMRLVHEKKYLSCPSRGCNKTFPNRARRKRHLSKVHGEKRTKENLGHFTQAVPPVGDQTEPLAAPTISLTGRKESVIALAKSSSQPQLTTGDISTRDSSERETNVETVVVPFLSAGEDHHSVQGAVVGAEINQSVSVIQNLCDLTFLPDPSTRAPPTSPPPGEEVSGLLLDHEPLPLPAVSQWDWQVVEPLRSQAHLPTHHQPPPTHHQPPPTHHQPPPTHHQQPPTHPHMHTSQQQAGEAYDPLYYQHLLSSASPLSLLEPYREHAILDLNTFSSHLYTNPHPPPPSPNPHLYPPPSPNPHLYPPPSPNPHLYPPPSPNPHLYPPPSPNTHLYPSPPANTLLYPPPSPPPNPHLELQYPEHQQSQAVSVISSNLL